MSNYKAISATSQVKLMGGKLKSIFVSSAGSTPKITVYDSGIASASDPVVIAEFVPVSATVYNFGFDGPMTNNGIYVVLAGTITATVIFE